MFYSSPDVSREYLDTREGQKLLEIMKSDDLWNDPEKRHLAQSIYRDAGYLRDKLPHFVEQLKNCRPEVGEQLLQEFEENAKQLAKIEQQLEELERKHHTTKQAMLTTSGKLKRHEHERKAVMGLIRFAGGGEIIKALLAEDIKAAQLGTGK